MVKGFPLLVKLDLSGCRETLRDEGNVLPVCFACMVTSVLNENDHFIPSDLIAQLVEKGTGVPEGASSNPA